MKTGAAFFAAVGFVLASPFAPADVPDLTELMTFLCNPNASNSGWSSSQARAITSIYPYRGKLYTSGGDWYANTGASPIFAVDPETGAFVSEFVAGTETINYLREDSAGRLYAPGVDQREGHANVGALFRRDLDGNWKALLTVPYGNIQDLTSPSGEGFAMHTWDLCCWKGNVFTAGYGIACGPEGSNATMANTTPQLEWSQRQYTNENGSISFAYRRFSAFLAFDDELFCVPSSYLMMSDQGRFPPELWRYNAQTLLFECSYGSWDDLAPGLTMDDAAIAGSGYANTSMFYTMLWHPTPFKGRVLYIAGMEGTSTRPYAALYSAANDSHKVKAVRIGLGDGALPYCIAKHTTRHGDEFVTVLAAQYDSSRQKVLNSVWESADGVTFTRLFTFSSSRHASAIARCGESYFVGMGWSGYCPYSWTLSGEDISGNIYRIPFRRVYRPLDLSPAVSVVKDNGASARLSVKVSAMDAASASLSLVFNGNVVTNWENVVEGETYSASVATTRGSVYDFTFIGAPAGYSEVASSGTFLADAYDGWFRVDFNDPGYKTGADWTDLKDVANPGGTWTDGSGKSVLVEATANAPRHVAIDGDALVVFTPSAASSPGSDVLVTGRVAVVASPIADAMTDPSMVASLYFALEGDAVIPYGYAGGAWSRLSGCSQWQSGQWVDYEIEIDLNSSAAPRVQFRIDGAILTSDGAEWLPLGTVPDRVSSVAYRGTGAIGNFAGDTRVKTIAEFPVPVIGGGGSEGETGGGLAFGTDSQTGLRTFSATVSNPVAGAYYTAFTTTSLQLPFTAECCVQAKQGDEVIPLEVDASVPAKFVKIVVSSAPFAPGAPLPK